MTAASLGMTLDAMVEATDDIAANAADDIFVYEAFTRLEMFARLATGKSAEADERGDGVDGLTSALRSLTDALVPVVLAYPAVDHESLVTAGASMAFVMALTGRRPGDTPRPSRLRRAVARLRPF